MWRVQDAVTCCSGPTYLAARRLVEAHKELPPEVAVGRGPTMSARLGAQQHRIRSRATLVRDADIGDGAWRGRRGAFVLRHPYGSFGRSPIRRVVAGIERVLRAADYHHGDISLATTLLPVHA